MFPVTSTIAIQSEDTVFSVTNDRCQAGTSPYPGHIYLLLNRIHLNHDSGGITEPLRHNGLLNLNFNL